MCSVSKIREGQYLEWAQAKSKEHRQPSNEATGAAPELTRLLDFLSDRTS
jgi:hypothetical protein